MKNNSSSHCKLSSLIGIFFIIFFINDANSQSFSLNNLNFNGKGAISEATNLTFGPDDRLYVAEYTGKLKIFTIQRNGPGDYVVTGMEVLTDIGSIQDHNDDGSLNASVERETIGLIVTGTAANPVIYVSSSDFRIGGAGNNGDRNLDTNSGIITRFTWTGNEWEVVDLVRGLPRSEENHATNNMVLVNINGTNYLLVSQGGNTNGGAPSQDFAYLGETALSAAILSVNIDMINAMPIQNDNGRNYIYDLPTLDDPTRPNVNGIIDPDNPSYGGIDVNDPFGGNDGLNQAVLVSNGPVQIFSPGYRNTFDLVVTENGALYVTENGANGGWGGFPMNEGGGNVTNEYDPNEPGSSSPSGGEYINNKDHLILVTTNIQNYTFGSFYGGHPNPVRANPQGAGLYTNPSNPGTAGAVFRTQIYDPDGSIPGSTTNPNIGLPANWPPVQQANSVEGDWQGPGIDNPDGPEDQLVTIWGTNTNALAEYTATNFNGAMKGDLLAGVNTGVLRRVELKPDGSLEKLTPSFVSGLGGNALGVTCNSDTDIFPGTIWVVLLTGNLMVMEPQDFNCISPGQPGYDPLADYDLDGYTTQDEGDNNTDPCNGASQPRDFDKSSGDPLESDLNDPDDDNDGILDKDDPLQIGAPDNSGPDAFQVPVINELFSDNPVLKGYLGLGFTGLMNNGDPNKNWLDWLDRRDDPNDPNPNDILGGAIGAMTMQMTSGTALGTTNSQEKGFQYGIQVNSTTEVFTVSGNLSSFDGALQLYGNTSAPNAELGFFIGDGTQSNYIKFVITPQGLVARQEINDTPMNPIELTVPVQNRPSSGATFYFIVNPSNGVINLEYSFDAGLRTTLGSITAQGPILNAIQQSNDVLVVGLIGTSNAVGVEVEGTWNFLKVTGSEPAIVADIPDQELEVGAPAGNINLNTYFDDDQGTANLTYTIEGNTNAAIVAAIVSDSILNLVYPPAPAVSDITIRATDVDLNFVEQTFRVSLTEPSIVLYRVNAGGPAIAAIDGEMDWAADKASQKSPYLQAGGINTAEFGMNNYAPEVDQTTTPASIYSTERWDNPNAPEMAYSFPVQSGTYEVRLYMGNGYDGTSNPGARIFDVAVEGTVYPRLDNLDLSAAFGHQTGGVVSLTLDVTDGALDIVFIHGVENPLVNGIEILGSGGASIQVVAIPDQTNLSGEVLDGSLGVSATGGYGNLTYSMTGAPAGVTIEPTNGQIGGTIDAAADLGSPYAITVTVDDSDGLTNDAVDVGFIWNIINDEPWVDKAEAENYTARHECSFVQAGDKFYLMGGRESAKTVDIYDYIINTWTSLPNSAPFEFNHYQAVEYQGLIWVIGAFKDNGFPTETPAEFIWIFNPATQEWVQGPQIPVNRRRGSAGLVIYQDKFYIVGGNTDGHNGGYVSWFDEYDPATGTWAALADAPRARDHFQAAIIGNKLYAVGGRLSGGVGGTFKPVIAEVDVYDFASGTWSTLPQAENLPTLRGAPAVVNFNDKLVVIGGEVENEMVYGVNTSGALKITEEYDPVTNTWNRLPDLNHQRHGTQAIVSGEGIFILAGSPNLGGGNQKNMEYLGEGAPVGYPSVVSVVTVPSAVQVNPGVTSDITLEILNGNTGVFIKSMAISGSNAANFVIASGQLTNALLNPNSTHVISIDYTGATAGETATLTINYGAAGQAIIALESTLGTPAIAKTEEVSLTESLGLTAQISPNPVFSETYLRISDPMVNVLEVYLYESGGQLVKVYNSQLENLGQGEYRFNVFGLPNGVYLVKIKTDSNRNPSVWLIKGI